MEGVLIPVAVFLAVYAAITFELVNKAVAAMLGVTLLLFFHSIEEHRAVSFIDFETIVLLLGMMAIVAILRRSGFFAILSVKIAELTKGSPLKILILFSAVTAFLSAFLDNVTTVLIVIPIVLELTSGMGINPRIYVISLAVISNIGGAATLIGDPPNIIIGSKVGLTFNQFLASLFIPVILTAVVSVFFIWVTNRKQFKPIDTNLAKLFSVHMLLAKIRNDFLNISIDTLFLWKSLGGLVLVILMFISQTLTKISPGVSALFVAMLLMLVSKMDVEEVLEEIEWGTLLFFAGLFILVGVLEDKGVMEWIAENVFLKIGDNPYIMVLSVLWVSGLASGFLDNIPFTITMIPIVSLMLESNPVPNNILWWALALGACFGGNLTLIGASANIVSVGIAKKAGHDISFLEFIKTSASITIISLVIVSIFLSIYLWFSL